MSKDGEIRLGNNVKLFSRRFSNPLVLDVPCSFRLMRPGAKVILGDDTAISGSVICAATSVEIGQRVLIGANCRIFDTDFHPLLPEARRVHATRDARSKPIFIGDEVFIGAHCLILKGSILGDGCVVGAGSVVSGTFPARSVIAGNPAVVVRSLTYGGDR